MLCCESEDFRSKGKASNADFNSGHMCRNACTHNVTYYLLILTYIDALSIGREHMQFSIDMRFVSIVIRTSH